MENILNKYAEYKGIELTEENTPTLTAYLKRAISVLETKIGCSLTNPVEAALIGVSKHGCDCSMTAPDELDPVPTPVGTYRVAPFDKRLQFQRLDPFTTLNALYIGKRTENTGEIIILKKLVNYQPSIRSNGIGNYVKGCSKNPCAITCGNTCGDCVSLVVDADWMSLDNLPDELLYMIFDFMDWMAEGGFSNGGITSESVDGHSVSYGEWNKVRGYTPYDDPNNQAILANYIGAYGNTSRQYIH